MDISLLDLNQHVDDLFIPNDYKIFDERDGKIVKLNIDKIFNIEKDTSLISAFKIQRQAHSNSMEATCQYINYLIMKYDVKEEIVVNYIRLKTIVDMCYAKDSYDEVKFIRDLKKYLLSPYILGLVKQMTKDNFIINYETDFKGDESLKFDNKHCKILMNISTAYKLVIPIINHFTFLKYIKGEDLKTFTENIFTIIAKEYQGQVNIINKIFTTCKSKCASMEYSNKPLWDKIFAIYGKSTSSYLNILYNNMTTVIIPKYKYSQNILALNKQVIRTSTVGECAWQTPYIEKEIDDIERDEDGLSKLDKIEINSIKNDESEVIINKINIKQTLNLLMSKYGEISEEEFTYYIENISSVNEFQLNMISLLFAQYFGSPNVLGFLKFHQYIQLIIIMKRMLKAKNFNIIQHLLSGNIDKINTRKNLSERQSKRILINEKYKFIKENKYKNTNTIEEANIIEKIISTLSFSPIRMVDYDLEEFRGNIIDVHPDIISDECLRFITLIS